MRGFFLGIVFVFAVALLTGWALLRRSQGFSTREQPTAMEAWASSAMGLLRAGKKKLPAALPKGGAKGRDGVVPCASSLGKEAARSNREGAMAVGSACSRGARPWLLAAGRAERE